MSDGYVRLRRFFEDISGTVAMDSTTGDTVAKAGRPLDTIYVQRIVASIVSAGVAGSVWRITDTDGSILLSDLPADEAKEIERDLGATGRACKEGEGLVITADPPGATGLISWDGYRKRTGVGAA